MATLKAGSVDSTELANDAVTSTKIKSNAVTSAKLASGAVGAAALNVSGNGTSGQALVSDGDGSFSWQTIVTTIADGSISTAKLANNAVTTNKIANDAVTSAKIADYAITNALVDSDAITADNIADNAVGADALNVSGDGTSGQSLVSDGDGTFSWSSREPIQGFYTRTGLTFSVAGGDPANNEIKYGTGSYRIVASDTIRAEILAACNNGYKIGFIGTKGNVYEIAQILSTSDNGTRLNIQVLGVTRETSNPDNHFEAVIVVANESLFDMFMNPATSFPKNWISGTAISDNTIGADALNVSGNGTTGQALVSDGDGSFSWTTITASGS